MRLEIEPVRCNIAAERTLARVSSGMTAAMHVEEGSIAEDCTACTHKHRLSLTEIGQDLFVGEVRQQVHEMCIGTVAAASSSISHLYVRYPCLPDKIHTHSKSSSVMAGRCISVYIRGNQHRWAIGSTGSLPSYSN